MDEQEVLDEQVKVWTAEIGRLTELVAAATGARCMETSPGCVVVPQAALLWLLGMGDGAFTPPASARGEFWWRSAFLCRAGLEVDLASRRIVPSRAVVGA